MVISISFAAVLLVLICGVVALLMTAKANAWGSATTWWAIAYWIGFLALLGGVVIRA